MINNDKNNGICQRLTLALTLMLGSLLSLDVQAASSTVQTAGSWWGLNYRKFDFYIPANLPANRPMLVIMHGHGGSRESIAHNESTYAFADANQIAVLWPEGSTWPLNSWNAGPCCSEAGILNMDDVSYLDRAIGDVKNRAGTDDTRVYMTGHSNGAIMTQRYALQKKGMAAIYPMSFPVTDNWLWQMPQAWKEGRKTPVRAVHSRDDDLLFYNGGVALPGLILPFGLLGSDSAQKGLSTSASINSCGPVQIQEKYPSHVDGAPTDMDVQRYENCAMDSAVHLVSLPLGKHGGVLKSDGGSSATVVGVGADGKPLTAQFHFLKDAWAFMTKYVKPGHKADRMWYGQELKEGQYLISENKQYKLDFQADGNLVLRDNAGRQQWASNTVGNADRFVMQQDGNLAIYVPGYIKAGPWYCLGLCNTWVPPKAVWSTGTSGPGESRVQIGNDGRFMVMRNNVQVWRN
jgi:poly(3-hydroxybutyrate) depolymerase